MKTCFEFSPLDFQVRMQVVRIGMKILAHFEKPNNVIMYRHKERWAEYIYSLIKIARKICHFVLNY